MPENYDSLLIRPLPTPIARSEYYARGRGLPDADAAGQPRAETFGDSAAVAPLALLMLAVLAVTVHRSHRYILFRARDFFARERRFSDARTGKGAGERRGTLLLTGVLCLSLGLMAGNRLALHGGAAALDALPIDARLVPLALGAALMALVLAKGAAYAAVNWVFFDRESRGRWLSAYFFLTSACSFAAFPLAMIDIYRSELQCAVAICSLGAFILYKILLFYKLNANFRLKRYSVLLLFLYFCTAEILPSLVMWRLLGLAGFGGDQ